MQGRVPDRLEHVVEPGRRGRRAGSALPESEQNHAFDHFAFANGTTKMFTRVQMATLRISALICLGFVLGLLAVSPSFNQFLERNSGTLVNDAAVRHTQVELQHERGAVDCSDLNSASCRNLRAAYDSYLGGGREGDQGAASDRVRSESPETARRGRQNEEHSNLRVVTVFNGSNAREFLVPAETN